MKARLVTDIRAQDADSLAGALLALVKSGDRAAEDLQDALKEANKDAARYRWLRENRDVLLLTGFFGNGCINRTIGEVDAAIDAAMKTPND